MPLNKETKPVDEILLPKYMNWSTNFRVLPFNEKMALSWLKNTNSVQAQNYREHSENGTH